MEFITGLFDTSDFPARWRCGHWTPAHGWLHILSDVSVWAAYFAIPLVLGYFAARRRDLPFRRVFLLFVAFILLCGTTHLMEAVIFWWPAYRLAGVFKLLTAVVSWVTVFALVRVAPAVLAMRSPAELEREVAARTDAEWRLTVANAELERRVEERTADLARSLAALRQERELLGTTLASIGDAVVTTDSAVCVTGLNKVAESLTGWTNSEARGQPLEGVFQIVNEATRLPVQNPALRALKDGVIVGLANHTVLISKDGRERPIDDSAAPIRDKDGNVVGSVLVFRDITERHKAAQALRRSEEKFRATFEQAAIGIAHVGLDGQWLHVNARLCDILGFSRDELTTRTFLEITHPDDLAEDQAKIRELMAGEASTYSLEKRYVRKDGSFVWADLTVSLVRTPGGQPDHFISVVEDISARKRVEDALRENEERFRLAAERLAATQSRAPVGIVETTTDEEYVSVNDEFCHITGYTKEELLARRVRDIIHPDDYPHSQEMFERMLAGEVSYMRLVKRYVRKNGSVAWVDVNRTLLRNAAGQPLYVIGAVLDITARREAEERLRESEERSAFVRRSSGVGFWYCDLPFHELQWDDLVKTHFHLPPDAAVTIQVFYDRIHPDDRDPTRQAIERSITGRTPYNVVYRTVHPDTGAVRWVRALGRTFYAADGTPTRFDGVTLDVSEQKRAEEERERLVGQLRESNRRKDEFLATLAHELRNPLAPIRNGLQVMRLAGVTGTVEMARSMMERQLTQMVRLVDDLLDVSRVTSGKMELRTERLELRAVIHAAIETARPIIEGAGHELILSMADEPLFVNGDHTRLAQVVANLLINAAKYTPQGGHIRLAIGQDGGTAVVSVADDGIGIPPDMLQKVFLMFTQVDRTLEKTTGGLGIGLSLVKGLVEMHGGTIEARSEGEGKGSEFVLRLPVATPAPAQPKEANTKGEDVAPSGRRRILVVDDNADAADSLAQLLELFGNEVRTTYDGEAGIEAARAFRPAVVLCDLGMPKVNGYDTARRIRAEPWGQSIMLVALSGWGQEDDRQRSTEAGFNFHLVKPVETTALMQLLGRVETV